MEKNPRMSLALAFLAKDYSKVGEFYDADSHYKECKPILFYHSLLVLNPN